jgi:hypothetical protein
VKINSPDKLIGGLLYQLYFCVLAALGTDRRSVLCQSDNAQRATKTYYESVPTQSYAHSHANTKSEILLYCKSSHADITTARKAMKCPPHSRPRTRHGALPLPRIFREGARGIPNLCPSRRCGTFPPRSGRPSPDHHDLQAVTYEHSGHPSREPPRIRRVAHLSKFFFISNIHALMIPLVVFIVE